MASNTIQRNAIVSPFPVKTPLLDEPPAKGNRKQPQTSNSGVSRAHTVWFQSVENGVNAAPQITGTTPATSASPGQPGTIAFDANWLYICVGVNIWKRAALNSF